ncbi:MAG TPA: hypothetical protein PLD23_14710 [Armatimonadota bacterium]|nr:hypothetical protein [Armatimonadota bacterium]
MMRIAAIVMAGLLVAGCGDKKAKTAESADACMKMFVDAIGSGDAEAAADLFDYEAYARAHNEDWDDIATGQRNEIIGKIRADKTASLKAQLGSLQGDLGYTSAGPATGGQAVYSVTANGVPVGNVTVRQTGKGWKVTEAFGSGPA